RLAEKNANKPITRRKRISQFWPSKRREGVMARVMQRKTSVQVPSEFLMNSVGLALNSSRNANQTRGASGARDARKIGGFSHRMLMCRDRSFMFEWKRKALSVIFSQVHPVVQAGHLVAVAVEHQRLDALAKERSIQAPFGRLAPAGMIHLRIDVRVEAILMGIRNVPCRRRH